MNKANIIKKIGIVTGVVLLVGLLGRFTYNSYNTYRDTIISQQQEQLLTISKTLCRSLGIYFEEQVTNLAIYAKSNGFGKKLLLDISQANKLLFEEQTKVHYENWDFDAICLIDQDGNICYIDEKRQDNNRKYIYDFSSLVENQVAGVGEIYEVAPNRLMLTIVQPIYNDKKQIGALVGLLDMENIFYKLIKDTKVGGKGYVTVKDGEERIIMHPVKEQVGQRVIEGRKSTFPDLDYSDLEDLMTLQYTQDEGKATYYSYWWDEKKLRKVKKISSFANVKAGMDTWIISSVMDYSEMAEPINKNLIRLLELTGIIIIIIAITALIIFLLEKKRQDLLVESKYLKNINYTLSELQKTEKQIKHYEKLQSIETLTGGIAHEFNNLMTPILGYSQLAIATMEKENEYYDDMEEIYNASYKAKELVKQIMLFSRRDKIGMDYKVIDLAKEVMNGLRMVRVGLRPNIELVETIICEGATIYGNSIQIQQVLINICNNAGQAIKENGGTIKVSLYKVTKEEIENVNIPNLSKKPYICLSISDTGCGMPEEVLKRIFDPFFTTKKVGEGTGVGLSVVKGIVRNHKGEIVVESKEDQGSLFKVYLPIVDAQVLESEKELSSHCIKRKLTILLIEDDTRVIKLVKKSVMNMGYAVEAYTDVLKALDYFKQHPRKFDLIITDYAMPKLTGTQLAEVVKEVNPSIKIILITGLVVPEVIKHVRYHIIDTFVMKPIDYEELDKKIQELLSDN